ncbi:MAG: glycosyltransferase [Solobacterium sp.]|nr:glycosyltransferase [Solobacterium sp.]
MKIGEFSDSFLPVVDGVGRVVYSYCESIAKTGNEVSAIVPLTRMGYRGNYPFEIIDYYSRALPGLEQYRMGMPLIDEHFRQHLDMTEFDIVHAHTPFIAGPEAIHYAKKHHIPLVGTFHSKYYDDFVQISGSRIIAGISTDVLVAEFFNKCDEVWALSQRSAETLRSYGYNRDIFIMPNGMDIHTITESQKERAIQEFGIHPDVPVLLYVGQMNWKKNIALILEACASLKQSGQRIQLVLAGQGHHEEEIKEKTEALGLTDDTVFTGHVKDSELLYGLYAAADLFVFPSTYDTFSMVVREAANAETASVCVQGSSAAECIEDGVNGLLCHETSKDLFEVLSHALEDKSHIKEMGLCARKTIPISWDTITQRVLERYQYLIDHYQETEA